MPELLGEPSNSLDRRTAQQLQQALQVCIAFGAYDQLAATSLTVLFPLLTGLDPILYPMLNTGAA